MVHRHHKRWNNSVTHPFCKMKCSRYLEQNILCWNPSYWMTNWVGIQYFLFVFRNLLYTYWLLSWENASSIFFWVFEYVTHFTIVISVLSVTDTFLYSSFESVSSCKTSSFVNFILSMGRVKNSQLHLMLRTKNLNDGISRHLLDHL